MMFHQDHVPNDQARSLFSQTGYFETTAVSIEAFAEKRYILVLSARYLLEWNLLLIVSFNINST